MSYRLCVCFILQPDLVRELIDGYVREPLDAPPRRRETVRRFLMDIQDDVNQAAEMINVMMDEVTEIQSRLIAPNVWEHIRPLLETALARATTYGVESRPRIPAPTPARQVRCPVCYSNLPTVVLDCQHTICPACLEQCGPTCPMCRRDINRAKPLYYDSDR